MKTNSLSTTPSFTEAARKETDRYNKKLAMLREEREREIQGVKNNYDVRVKNIEKDADQRVYEARVLGSDNLKVEMKHQENVLSDYAQGVKDRIKLMDEQRQQISLGNQNAIVEMEENHLSNIQERMSHISDKSQDLDLETDLSLIQIKSKADSSVRNSEHITKERLKDKYRENEAKLRSEDRRFVEERSKLARTQSEALQREQMQGYQDIEKLKGQNQMRIAQEKQISKDQLEFQKRQFEEMLKAQKIAYKQKVEALVREHEANMKHIIKTQSHELEELTRSQIAYKSALSSRSDDPFYSVSALSPVVTDLGKFYEIKLEVPAYEEQNVILSTDKRNIKINHSRRAANDIQLEDGSWNKSKRSESFTKEISVAEILDSEKISRNYQDGVLTFRVHKA